MLKREHCFSKVGKQGIPPIIEKCFLSAIALNLKRMVKAILLISYKLKRRAENINFQPSVLCINSSFIIPDLKYFTEE